MVGASCLDGCVNATSVDRQSNEACELGGCDYCVRARATSTPRSHGKPFDEPSSRTYPIGGATE